MKYSRSRSSSPPPLMSTEKLEKHERALKLKIAGREKKDEARMVLFQDYYKNKGMKVHDTSTVQEHNKSRRVEMGAK
jgi:hypothetical protein